MTAYGLLNIWKPSGPTSHDIVEAVRRGTDERRIGHAGTLDPLADGVLVLALGKATRLVEYLAPARKQYRAAITLGLTTDTYDSLGTTITRSDVQPNLTQADIELILTQFIGSILQVPPAYSAIKVGGKPAYARARAGQEVRLAARPVTIYDLRIVAYDAPVLQLDVTCSAGTYIRSLAHDLGQELACGATLSRLRRVAVGEFQLDDSVAWNSLCLAFEDGSWEKHIISADRAAAALPQIMIDDQALTEIYHGRSFKGDNVATGLCRAYAQTGELAAILKAGPGDGLWYPHKVLIDANDLERLTSA